MAVSICLLAAMTAAATASVRTQPCTPIRGCSFVVPPPTAATKGVFAVKVTAGSASAGKAGTIKTQQAVFPQLSCPGYKLRARMALSFQLLTATPLNVTYTVTETITNTNPEGIEFCLAAAAPFKALSGTKERTIKLAGGTSEHVGLLPLCASVSATAPCLQSVNPPPGSSSTTTSEDVTVTARIPAKTAGGDPWGGS